MPSKKSISRERYRRLQRCKKNDDLQLDVDILKETIKILKKGRGADITAMKNHEKAVVVDALKYKYSLLLLL